MLKLIVLIVVIFYGGYLVSEISLYPEEAVMEYDMALMEYDKGLGEYPEDKYPEKDNTNMLLGFFTWIIAIIATFIWYLWGRSAEDIGQITSSMFQGAKKCRYCLKSLPSVWTAKCPHCTADL